MRLHLLLDVADVAVFAHNGDGGLGKVQRVAEALQFAVVVERGWAVVLELEALEEVDFFAGGIGAHCRNGEKFVKARFFGGKGVRLHFDKLKFHELRGSKALIQDDFHGEGLEVDVPGVDQGIEESGAMVDGDVEDVGIEEFENDGAHFFVGALAEFGDSAQPVFVVELLFGDSLGYVQEFLGDQAFELAESLFFKNVAKLVLFGGGTFADDQATDFAEKGRRGGGQSLLELFAALSFDHGGKLAFGEF